MRAGGCRVGSQHQQRLLGRSPAQATLLPLPRGRRRRCLSPFTPPFTSLQAGRQQGGGGGKAAAGAAASDTARELQRYLTLTNRLAAQGLPALQGAPFDVCMSQNCDWALFNGYWTTAVQQWPVEMQRALVCRCPGR